MQSYEFEHDPVKAANRTRTLRRLSRASSNCSCTVAPDDHQQQQHTQPLAAGSKSVLNGSQEGRNACAMGLQAMMHHLTSQHTSG